MPLSADFPKGFSDSEGCSLHVTIHLDPANLEAWFEAFRTPYEGCLSEKDCTFFAVYQDPEQPGVVSWVEHWTKNPEWLFENQFTKEYYKGYFKITEPMFVKPREARWLRRVPGYTGVKDE